MARPIITLTTDFGTNDHLVGVMKGVILSINPEVNIVDITHSVLAHDLLDGALTIGQAYKYFPPKTVHLVVVDPGVGSARRPILVAGDTHYFVAPDNGVLSSVYDQTEALYVWNIISEHYFRQPVSKTFHGRDIFAPVAAWLTKSWQSSAFGEAITDFARFAHAQTENGGQHDQGRGAARGSVREPDYQPARGRCAGVCGGGRKVHDSRRERDGDEARPDIFERSERRGHRIHRIERISGDFD